MTRLVFLASVFYRPLAARPDRSAVAVVLPDTPFGANRARQFRIMLALRRASSRASSLLGRGRTFAALGDKAPDVALDVSFPGPKVCSMMQNLQSTSQQLLGRELRAALQGPPRHPLRAAGRLHAHLIHEEHPGLPRGNRGARGEKHRRSHHLGRQRRGRHGRLGDGAGY